MPFTTCRWFGIVRPCRGPWCLWLLALLLAGCAPHAADELATAEPEPAALPVVAGELKEIQPETWPAIVRTQGSLVADEVAVVGAKVAGRVTEVLVDLGDAVKAGDPLVQLDPQDYKLQVALAEAQLVQVRAAVGLKPEDPVEKLDPLSAPPVREAKAVWDEAKARLVRVEQLHRQRVITDDEYDQTLAAERVAEARYSSAINNVREMIAQISVRSAELEVARQNLADATVVAAFEGQIEQRHVAPGAYVQIGQPLVTMVRSTSLRFRGMIPERHAQRLELGQPLQLQIESVAEPRSVVVTRISPAVDQARRSLMFEAEVPNEDGSLRAGLFAEAEVVVDPQRKSIVVPETAITEFAGVEKVWVVVDGKPMDKMVQTGSRRHSAVEIIEGLKAGDVILLNPGDRAVGSVTTPAATTPGIIKPEEKPTALNAAAVNPTALISPPRLPPKP